VSRLLRFLALILLTSCIVPPGPTPKDTEFDPSKRNWAEVYRHEIKRAVENEDSDAYHFFFQEYMRERIRQERAKKSNAK